MSCPVPNRPHLVGPRRDGRIRRSREANRAHKPAKIPLMSTALITGASGGIGYELAKLFARDHHNLVLVARSADKLAQVSAELRAQNVTVRAVALDLATP